VAALATHGRGHRTFRRGGRNSSLVSPSLRRPLSKSACLTKTCKLHARVPALMQSPATQGFAMAAALGDSSMAASGQKIEVEVPQESHGRLRAPGSVYRD
jgi:hypothetical protein